MSPVFRLRHSRHLDRNRTVGLDHFKPTRAVARVACASTGPSMRAAPSSCKAETPTHGILAAPARLCRGAGEGERASGFEPEGIHTIAYVGPRIARLDHDLRLAERVHQAPRPAATVGDRRRQSWIEAADRDDTDAGAIQGARLLRKLRRDGLAEADETPASAQELVSSRAKRGDTADVKRAVQRSSSR
jgi:hypothetical protein